MSGGFARKYRALIVCELADMRGVKRENKRF